MKLVEAESEGPVEGDDAIVTPPRPPHRRVSVSLVFTLVVLTATVVLIYTVFPARNNVLITEALKLHRDPPDTWDLTNPSESELRGWAIGVAGKGVPLPKLEAVWARRIELFDRGAALVRFKAGSEELTYLVQHARGIAPDHRERTDGEAHAFAWRNGAFLCVAVGPDGTRSSWRTAVGVR